MGFTPGQGVEFDQVSDEHYELVIRRSDTAWWQQIFLLFPDLRQFRTKDLFERHPTKPHLWRWVGRADDTIRIPHGDALDALEVGELEVSIEQAPSVHTALMAGSGRARPFLLVEPMGESRGPDVLERVRKDVEAACASWPPWARIDRRLVLLTDPARPLARSAKGSLLRAIVLADYAADIDALYAQSNL